VFAAWLAPFDPDRQDLLSPLEGPSKEHWLGTDTLGRDVLSRLIYGTRTSLIGGGIAVGVAFGLGVPMGLIAGYKGKSAEKSLSFFSNSLLSVPGLVLAIAVVTSLGAGLISAMLAVGLVMMPRFYHLARVATHDLRNELFIRASESIGCRPRRILFSHIMPNAMPPIVVQVTFALGTAILAEASLSFLGLGVRPPTASWGSMLANAATRLDKTYLIWGPGIALTLTVLAFAMIGDAIRDSLGVGRGRS
jgi:peptide/nickel transport system permease protein